ncbi:MAG: hypothetical protein J6S67_22300 [Methanobrevibacter sp.]|nr:hypothetical protein [Methanobrevibacter sp.]
MNWLISIIDALFWRIRGGLRFFGHKLPLNKFWFAPIFAGEFCYLTQWDLNVFIITTIATLVSYQEYGWGEVKGCALGVGKPDKSRSDCDLVDNIIDTLSINITSRDVHVWKWTIHVPEIHWKLTDSPILFGVVGTSLRMLLATFTMGLAIRNIPFMLCGLGIGPIYYIVGLFARKVLKKYDKTGWNISEWVEGFYLGAMLCISILYFS